MSMQIRDIFICHAAEDKDKVVRPMVEAFNQAGISCWYDEAEIKWGDSITQKINEGLATSRYVVVVFSISFIHKNWPQRELNAVLNQEASTGEVKVLPLIVGSEQEKAKILSKYPLLNDKRYLPWDQGLSAIVDALIKRLQHPQENMANSIETNDSASVRHIPLPKIAKEFTQRDRDIFLHNGFIIIKRYFKNALEELKRHYQEVEIDFIEVHNFKIIATIYLRGKVANKCKIWLGGMTTTDAIAYQAGQFTIDSDNSFNEMLFVETGRQALGFRPSGMVVARVVDDRMDLGEKEMSAEKAGEYLWQKFTESIK